VWSILALPPYPSAQWFRAFNTLGWENFADPLPGANLFFAADPEARAVAEELLLPQVRRWELDRPLGIIAGTADVGLGRLLLSFEEASDGTVTVAETRIEGASGHLCLPVTHSTLLLSARVARATADFLEHGTFAT